MFRLLYCNASFYRVDRSRAIALRGKKGHFEKIWLSLRRAACRESPRFTGKSGPLRFPVLTDERL
jgi:hypothetical protein